jgi:hypothetical protein
MDQAGGVSFPVKDLPLVISLTDRISVIPSESIAAMWELLVNTPDGGSPVVLELDTSMTMTLSWQCQGREFFESAPVSSTPALMALGVPIVAADSTWQQLLSLSHLPVVIGRIRMNLDGFLEIDASMPQKVELSNIPALFRIDDTHFGVPVSYAPALDSVPGLVWASRKPTFPSPVNLSGLPMDLSAHAKADLSSLANSLSSLRAQAVVWSPGLGRRVFCLAAVEVLDAYPLLIVTEPHAVWAWQRHLSLVHRAGSLSNDRGDVHIVTYHDASARARIASPAAIIFDSLDDIMQNPSIVESLHRLDGLVDAYRIACLSSFPDDIEEAIALMSLIRPVEFREHIPATLRYPVRPEQRAAEHVQAYKSERSEGSTGGFRRSRVEVLDSPDKLLEAMDASYETIKDDTDLLAELTRLVSVGQSYAVSPKISRAVELAKLAFNESRSIALVTRHEQTAQMLHSLLRTHKVPVVTNPVGDSPAIVRYASRIPDLRGFNEVVILDYPWSTSLIDDAVGSPLDENAPDCVTVLHLRDTVDDRVAMLAARRREQAQVADVSAPPSKQEVNYLLVRRR